MVLILNHCGLLNHSSQPRPALPDSWKPVAVTVGRGTLQTGAWEGVYPGLASWVLSIDYRFLIGGGQREIWRQKPALCQQRQRKVWRCLLLAFGIAGEAQSREMQLQQLEGSLEPAEQRLGVGDFLLQTGPPGNPQGPTPVIISSVATA